MLYVFICICIYIYIYIYRGDCEVKMLQIFGSIEAAVCAPWILLLLRSRV